MKITHDIHTHTVFGISNHLWDEKVPSKSIDEL